MLRLLYKTEHCNTMMLMVNVKYFTLYQVIINNDRSVVGYL